MCKNSQHFIIAVYSIFFFNFRNRIFSIRPKQKLFKFAKTFHKLSLAQGHVCRIYHTVSMNCWVILVNHYPRTRHPKILNLTQNRKCKPLVRNTQQIIINSTEWLVNYYPWKIFYKFSIIKPKSNNRLGFCSNTYDLHFIWGWGTLALK